jgi:hypothetical protein
MDKIWNFFPNNEKKKRENINQLMKEWKKYLSKSKVLYREDNKLYPGSSYFVADGFFPNYFNQSIKILFVGREARYISGLDIIEVVINMFKNNKIQGNQFWRRIVYMLYGIRHNGNELFKNIPDANTIALEISETNNYGFAFMNFSKYSNDCDDGASADIDLINKFLEDSKLNNRNYFKDELTILDPDIIITANLWDGKIKNEYLEYMFGNLSFIKAYSYKANLWTMEFNNKEIKIIDLYHFSYPGVSDRDYYYLPVVKLLYNK